ncbi:hypothetical protein DFJ66_8022 [Saccharothrix variisporea]|uniref:Uncharacterized protein n=1 Tax=Saccharothrix variisporea TaxID=543527 RepID=A0A495XN72_9PSEU|nr:hypothetical protein DFJ66_8022 [Saccharothrix variisporea]
MRGAIGATLGAVAAGLLGLFTEGLGGPATAILTIAGTLLGWGLEALFEKDKRRAATVVTLLSVLVIGAVLYVNVWRKAPTGDGLAQAPPPTAGTTAPAPNADPDAGTSPPPAQPTSGAEPSGDTIPVPTGRPPGPIAFTWLTDAVRISHVAPKILAFPRGQVGNGQQVDISFDNLSTGAVEFDVFDPGGSTFMGWSRGAPSYSFSVSYIFNPPTTGSYLLRIRDKETGAAAETSVHLEASSAGPYVVEAPGSADAAVSAVATGKGCDTEGTSIVVEYTGVAPGDTYVLTTPDGQHIRGGVSPDSVGHAIDGHVLRSDRCTGTSVPGFRVELHSAGGAIRTSDDFAVPN